MMGVVLVLAVVWQIVTTLYGPQIGAAAEWTITITGSGPAPTVRSTTADTPPDVVVVPPPPPPDVPPITDASPFTWPLQPPPVDYRGDDPPRYVSLCASATGAGEETCYAGFAEFPNPMVGSLAYACTLPAGMRWWGLPLGGMQLWVPIGWARSAPVKIRTLCAGRGL